MFLERITLGPSDEPTETAGDTGDEALPAMIARARSLGDPAEVIAFYRPYLSRLIGQQGGADVEGLLSEVETRATSDFTQFQGSTEAELTAWLHGLLRSVTADPERTAAWGEGGAGAATVAWHDPVTDGPGASTIPIDGVWASRLGEALAKLPPDERLAVQQHFLENRKLAEITQACGETPEAVVGRLRRGLQRLRAELRMP